MDKSVQFKEFREKYKEFYYNSYQIKEDEKQIDIVVESEEDKIAERLTLKECLSSLSEKDRAIIEYRYFKGETQTVVAKRLGMTQVQVSRREKVILKEMRLKMVV